MKINRQLLKNLALTFFFIFHVNFVFAGNNLEPKSSDDSLLEMELVAANAQKLSFEGHAKAQKILHSTMCSKKQNLYSFQLSKGILSPKELVKKVELDFPKKFVEGIHTQVMCWVKYENSIGNSFQKIFTKARDLFASAAIQAPLDKKYKGLSQKEQDQIQLQTWINDSRIGKNRTTLEKIDKRKVALTGVGVAVGGLLAMNGYRHRKLLAYTGDMVKDCVSAKSIRKAKDRFKIYRKQLNTYRKTIHHDNPVAKSNGMCCKKTKKFASTSRSLTRMLEFQRWMDGPKAPYSTLAVILGTAGLFTVAMEHAEKKENKKASNKFMGVVLTMLGLSKLFNVTGTASLLSKYDLIIQSTSSSGIKGLAKLGFAYSLLYPYLEVLIGLSYIGGYNETASHVATILTQGATALGVFLVILDGTTLRCACNGAGSKMQVGWVTFTESMAMVAMSVYGLIQQENREKELRFQPVLAL